VPGMPPKKAPARRRIRPRWGRIALVVVIALVVCGGGALIAARILLSMATSNVAQLQIPQNDAMVNGHVLDGPLNLLLVGIDDGQATGQENRGTTDARADSIMILHVPAGHDRGYLVSLPRDLWVSIPGHGHGKINAAYQFGSAGKTGDAFYAGGLDLLMRTIRQETGLSFNAAATVNFTGFTQAVTTLGGVTMYIDEKVTSVHYGTDDRGNPCVPARFDSNAVAHPIPGCHGKVYEVGTRRLTPEEALDYTRQREWLQNGDGDYGRQRHQQQFIKALVKEAKSQGLSVNPFKTFKLVSSMGSAVKMWTNGASVADWALTLRNLGDGELTMIRTNGGKFTALPESQTGGQSAEGLSSESRQMLADLRDDQIDRFIATHPTWVASDAARPSPGPSAR
jgi:polyisoprenyl-teichoic acid--peptidoglycan teichoic acid transferase